jgi:hypothetical protein
LKDFEQLTLGMRLAEVEAIVGKAEIPSITGLNTAKYLVRDHAGDHVIVTLYYE